MLINPDVAGFMTFDEIAKALSGYYRREERLLRRDWEIARWQIMHIIAPYSKKKNIKASDIAVFEWEKPKGVKVIPNREDVIDLLEKWERWGERNKT